MIRDEWKRMNLPMTWSIIKGDSDSVPVGLWELDLRAGVADGTYDVVCGDGGPSDRSRTRGVTVVNGEFDPATTAETCYRAVCVGLYEMGEREFAARPSIHHCFIEGLEYDAEVSAFVLDIGS